MGQLNSKILHKIPYGMVWEHANYAPNKSWANLRGNLLGAAWTSSIINFSFLENSSKYRWIGSYLSLLDQRISYQFYNEDHDRFSFVSFNFFKFGGFKQSYMFESVNRHTNIAVPGKVNFFSLKNRQFCFFNYYFKKFRRKTLKAKRDRSVARKFKLLRRSTRLPTPMTGEGFSTKTNHKAFIRRFLLESPSRLFRKKAKSILKYIAATPFMARRSYMDARTQFKYAKFLAFCTEHEHSLSPSTFQHARADSTGSLYAQHYSSVPEHISVNLAHDTLHTFTVDIKNLAISKYIAKRRKYINPTHIGLLSGKPRPLGRGKGTSFWAEPERGEYYRNPLRSSDGRHVLDFYRELNHVKRPRWVARMLQKKSVSDVITNYISDHRSSWLPPISTFYYYAFPVSLFVRASLLRSCKVRKKVGFLRVRNFF